MLERDGRRCVVSKILDSDVSPGAIRARANAGQLERSDYLEAAHIIPHSRNQADLPDGTLVCHSHLLCSSLIADRWQSEAKKQFWAIMEIFAPGVHAALDGQLIDSAYNGILLTMDLHKLFGQLGIWFEATEVSPLMLHPPPHHTHNYADGAPVQTANFETNASSDVR